MEIEIESITPVTAHRVGLRGRVFTILRLDGAYGPLWYKVTEDGFVLETDDKELEAQFLATEPKHAP